MHNGGTSPLILPDKRLLPDLQPPSGINLEVTPEGIKITPFIGDQAMQLTLPVDTATQLGVNLISAAAILRNVQAQAAQAKPAQKTIIVN